MLITALICAPLIGVNTGRFLDNIFVERLWRSVKYEYLYLNLPENGVELYHVFIPEALTHRSGALTHLWKGNPR